MAKGTTMKTTTKRSIKLPVAKGSPSAASRGDGVVSKGGTTMKIC